MLAVGGLVVAFGVAGCARPGTLVGGDGGGSVGSGQAQDGGLPVVADGMDCASNGDYTQPPPPVTPLPVDAVLVSASRCRFDPTAVPGDGEWLTRVEERADTGLVALAAALRLPSEQPKANQVCPDIGYFPVIITVTDSTGRAIHPELPHKACGGPLKAAAAAVEAVPWKTIRTTKLRQTRSELEVSSGCEPEYKPVVALAGLATDAARRQFGRPDVNAAPLRVCRFELDPDNPISVSGGPTFLAGKLVSASTLDGQAAHDLLAAVAAAPPATGTCSQPEAPFANVTAISGQAAMTIELGGCYRALIDAENFDRQLDAATVHRLLG